MSIKKVMILGAGFMGTGIAQVVATAGFEVLLWDVNESLVMSSINKIKERLDRNVNRGKMSKEASAEVLEKIQKVSSIKEGKNADLVIEAVLENIEIKRKIFKECDEFCKNSVIFASNTSAIPISTLAIGLSNPGRFIGLHFFSPVPAMSLVEIVRGLKTSQNTCDRAREFIKALGKEGVLVKDSPGFLINRIMHAFRNEVLACLQEGVATIEDIDLAVKLGLGHPMGPFELNDFAGLDIGYATSLTLYDGFKDPKWRPNLIVQKLVEAGECGVKSGKGWYDYSEGEKKPRNDLFY